MTYTKSYSKKAMMVLLALVMVLATATLSFAAERNGKAAQAKSGEITLENAKFVRANGKDYSLGMGTGVIESAKMDGTKITIRLKSHKVFLFTGKITEAYYTAGSNNLVTNDDSGYYMTLDKSKVVKFANGKKGIKLDAMKFSFSPVKPPGMPNPVKNVYFICDEFNK